MNYLNFKERQSCCTIKKIRSIIEWGHRCFVQLTSVMALLNRFAPSDFTDKNDFVFLCYMNYIKLGLPPT